MDVDWDTIGKRLEELDKELKSAEYSADQVLLAQFKLQSAAQPYLQPLEK